LIGEVPSADQHHAKNEKDEDTSFPAFAPAGIISHRVSLLLRKSFFFGTSLAEAKLGHESFPRISDVS
jgi:hypothetical protein